MLGELPDAELATFCELAAACLQHDGFKRPRMSQVAAVLRQIADCHHGEGRRLPGWRRGVAAAGPGFLFLIPDRCFKRLRVSGVAERDVSSAVVPAGAEAHMFRSYSGPAALPRVPQSLDCSAPHIRRGSLSHRLHRPTLASPRALARAADDPAPGRLQGGGRLQLSADAWPNGAQGRWWGRPPRPPRSPTPAASPPRSRPPAVARCAARAAPSHSLQAALGAPCRTAASPRPPSRAGATSPAWLTSYPGGPA